MKEGMKTLLIILSFLLFTLPVQVACEEVTHKNTEERDKLITYLKKIGRVNKGMIGKIVKTDFQVNSTHNQMFSDRAYAVEDGNSGKTDVYWVSNRVLMLNGNPLKFGFMYPPSSFPLGICFNNSNLTLREISSVKGAMDIWNAQYQVGYNKRILTEPNSKIPQTLFVESCDCDKHFVIQVRAIDHLPKDHFGTYVLYQDNDVAGDTIGILELNSAFLKSEKSDRERRGLMLHELGHALGFPYLHVPPPISELMSHGGEGTNYKPLSERLLTDSDIDYFIDHYVRVFGQ